MSPETGRAALKASRELGNSGSSGKADRALAPVKPAPAREPEVARNDPIKERFFPVDERPQAPIPVPTVTIQPPRPAQPPATTTASTPTSAAISGPIPMPRKKPASLRTG